MLKDHPDHAEYRFQYAVLLGGNPRLYHSLRIPGVEPNAAVLLRKLADEHPDNPEYSLALVNLMLRKFRLGPEVRKQHDALDEILFVSERMLGRWPNDPQVVSAVMKFHYRYIGLLRKRGAENKARKENERFIGILEILFYNPEISDAVREELIQLQLRRIAMVRSRVPKEELEAMRRKIEKELQYYHGSKLDEFRSELK